MNTGTVPADFESVFPVHVRRNIFSFILLLTVHWQLDSVSHPRDIHAALLYLQACAAHSISYLSLCDTQPISLYTCAARGISVDVFHDFYLSLRDTPLISIHTSFVCALPLPSFMYFTEYTLYKMLKTDFR